MTMIIAAINKVLDAIAVALIAVLELLPDSPFFWVEKIDSKVLDAINWLFPLGTAISHMQLYVTSVAIYYAIRVALRWLKAAGS